MYAKIIAIVFWAKLCVLSTVSAQVIGPAVNPSYAVVRIKSHGGSGTVIATENGRSWILSCAHMFCGRGENIDPALLNRPLKMDGPDQPYAIKRVANARVLAHDARKDLSLIELDNGPFHYVPVAAPNHPPGRQIYSIGYDNQTWPMTVRKATIVHSSGDTTYTVEKPWHGRSGGGLFDVDSRVLIGVVQGYEVDRGGRGLYVSHAAVLRFLQPHLGRMPRPTSPVPTPQTYQQLQALPQRDQRPFGIPFQAGPYPSEERWGPRTQPPC